MSDTITIETDSFIGSGDPNHHLPPEEWVQVQIDYNNVNISGSGLVEPINRVFSDNTDLVGVEIGVCLGVTTEYFAKNIKAPNLKLYAVDHYPTFVDWNGTHLSQVRQDMIKEHARTRLLPYMDKIEIVYTPSYEFVETLDDESLDFIFVDGDHSYEGASRDFKNFYPKVKSGAIFGGHDFCIQSVQKAILDVFGVSVFTKIQQLSNNAWYFIKD
jgi:Methyltransferase domain